MKRILLIAIALITINTYSQKAEENPAKEARIEKKQAQQNFSPEERASLRTKEMTLKYDLNKTQQEKIMVMNLEDAKAQKMRMDERKARMAERKDGEKRERRQLSKDERLKMMNERLDKKIERKEMMKAILNEEQFAKWEKAQEQERRTVKRQGIKGKRKRAKERNRNHRRN